MALASLRLNQAAGGRTSIALALSFSTRRDITIGVDGICQL